MKKPQASQVVQRTAQLEEQLRKLESDGRDNALLRFSLGQGYCTIGRHQQAVAHLAKAVALSPKHSATWKLYGKALAARGNLQAARTAYQRGIQTAQEHGDLQAAAEMRVFLRRLQPPPGANHEKQG